MRGITRFVPAAIAIAFTAGCTDLPTDTPDTRTTLVDDVSAVWAGGDPPVSVLEPGVAGAYCEDITFDGSGLANGDVVTSVWALGLPFTVEGLAYADYEGSTKFEEGPRALRVFDSDGTSATEDADLRVPSTGLMLLIDDWKDPHGTDGFYYADNERGGEMKFSFTPDAAYQYYMESYEAADNDEGEPYFTLYIDDVGPLASTTQQGDGSLELVPVGVSWITASFTFKLGVKPPEPHYTGSGAIDNIRLCRVENFTPGDDGCTIGFWKNHLSHWQDWGPEDTLEDAFDVPDALGMDDYSLLEALDFGGGKGVAGGARILLKQAVAALLNAADDDVAYGMSEGDVISAVNAALATMERDAMTDLAGILDGYNNAGCTLSGGNTNGGNGR